VDIEPGLDVEPDLPRRPTEMLLAPPSALRRLSREDQR
jgi:hypothetical protein